MTSRTQALLGPFMTLIPWSGTSSLHNSGETLRLLRPDGTEADVVTYGDTGGWTNEADGTGASLEWRRAGWDNALPEAWMGSCPWSILDQQQQLGRLTSDTLGIRR